MVLPLIMHVNYCEQGQTIDEICTKAVHWGFDGVEFRRKREGVAEEPEEYLDKIAKAVAHSGLKTVIFGSPGPNLASAKDTIRESEIEAAVTFYRLAAERFKLTVCNTFAGNITIRPLALNIQTARSMAPLLRVRTNGSMQRKDSEC